MNFIADVHCFILYLSFYYVNSNHIILFSKNNTLLYSLVILCTYYTHLLVLLWVYTIVNGRKCDYTELSPTKNIISLRGAVQCGYMCSFDSLWYVLLKWVKFVDNTEGTCDMSLTFIQLLVRRMNDMNTT